jgi:hypothetical protein
MRSSSGIGFRLRDNQKKPCRLCDGAFVILKVSGVGCQVSENGGQMAEAGMLESWEAWRLGSW